MQAHPDGSPDATAPAAAACLVLAQLPADGHLLVKIAWDASDAAPPAVAAGAVLELAAVAAEKLAALALGVLAQAAWWNQPLAEAALQRASAAAPCTPGAVPFAGRSSWAVEQQERSAAVAQPLTPLELPERSLLQWAARQRFRKPQELPEPMAALLAAEQQPAAHSHSAEALQPVHSAALPAAVGDE